jgi:hypothetical protein
MSVLDKLTEGIVNRDLQKEGAALLNKWENTGLLEGLNSDQSKDAMARVAFPIVRRVFGNLIANDLVSVQPMSLPSGLIFFLDFTTNADVPSPAKPGYPDNSSLYGGGVVANELTGGVSLTGDNLERGPYSLNNGFASPTGSQVVKMEQFVLIASGAAGGGGYIDGTDTLTDAEQDTLDQLTQYDPDLSGSLVAVVEFTGSAGFANLAAQNLITVGLDSTNSSTGVTANYKVVRRLTSLSSGSANNDPANTEYKVRVVLAQASGSEAFDSGAGDSLIGNISGSDVADLSFALADNFDPGGALGTVVGASEWQLEDNVNIPEIDIKVDSIAVTAQTKKLKAKWTPELGQDLSAYHNLDAEVELTSILSEQIALEIDREILEDLIKGATASTQYWSRRPGKFVTRDTGAPITTGSNENLLGADFTGTVSEWYETLAETINDVSAQIHRKTLRGGANFVVCSPEVANILEFTAGFRASIGNDYGNGQVGAVNVGSLSKKFDVYVDPYFPRNVVLVGRKGGSFLESGYVYAPYVPLQVTPTIFGVEDFVPRKGVMTRYAKKMVRPDMYGLVICQDLNG